MIKSMSKEQVIEQDILYAETLEEAFEQFPSRVISGTKTEMYQFLRKVWEQNKGNAYVDFYYASLPKENRKKFDEGLSKEEREILGQFEIRDSQVYYPLTETALEFLSEITAREWLFSGFYFGNKKFMVWGNYGLKYPVFSSDESILLEYMDLAEECGLEVRE